MGKAGGSGVVGAAGGNDMTVKGQALGKRIMDKPLAGSKWNKAEIEAIVQEIHRERITRVEAARRHGIGYKYLSNKIEQYHAGELK